VNPVSAVLSSTSNRRRRSSSSRTAESTTAKSSAEELEEEEEGGPLHARYYELIRSKDVLPDEHQLRALRELERVRRELLQYEPPALVPTNKPPSSSSSASSGVGGLFGSLWSSSSFSAAKSAIASAAGPKPPRGAYLHGGVGCGKTFLMNLLYDSLNDDDGRSGGWHHDWSSDRQKTHFHKFMLKVHQGMHVARYNNEEEQGKPKESDAVLPAVVDQIAKEGRFVCLDEFQGT